MKKEILNLLDEKNVDFDMLVKFYSGIKKVYTDKSSGIKTGFIGNALSKERLEADIDYCIKNYARNTKDKSKWLKRADILKKLNDSKPTKYYIQVVFKDTAMKIQSVMNSVNELDMQNEPKTSVIDLKNYDIPEEVIKYGILTDEKVKGGRFVNNRFIPDNIVGYLESETLKKLPKKQKELLPKNQKLEISINLKTICNKFIERECDKRGYTQETRLRYIKDVNRLIKYMEENKIYEIEKLDVDEFQNHIFTKKDEKGKTISKKH